MDDFDNLNSKTDSDLRQIAVAFGDFTPEEAESKTRDELLMAITGAKDIGDITAVDLAEEDFTMKAAPLPEPVKSTENQKSLDELIVDVGRTARFETNELADAMIKAEKKEKKVAKKVTEEAAKEPKEEKAKAEKKPARGRKKAVKAEEAAPAAEAPAAEAPAAEAPAAPAETAAVPSEAAEEAPKAEKKSARGRKPKKKADAPAEEIKAAEPTPIEEAVAQAAASEVSAEAPASEAPAAEAPATEAPAEAKAEEKKPEQAQGQGRHGRSKRRKITFGPGQDTKTVETVEEAPVAAEDEVPEVVLPVEIEIEGVLAINNNEATRMISAASFTEITICPARMTLMFPAR